MEKDNSVRIGIRFTEEDAAKVRRIAKFAGCNFSEAVRRIVRATQVEPAVFVLATDQPSSNGNSLAL